MQRAVYPEDHATWRDDKMGKATIHDNGTFLVGVNCLEPGQEHAAHTHTDREKLYWVVRGRGVFIEATEARPMQPGDSWHVERGCAHGIRNTSRERMLVLTVLAPRLEVTELTIEAESLPLPTGDSIVYAVRGTGSVVCSEHQVDVPEGALTVVPASTSCGLQAGEPWVALTVRPR